jgi:hypothetical protein
MSYHHRYKGFFIDGCMEGEVVEFDRWHPIYECMKRPQWTFEEIMNEPPEALANATLERITYYPVMADEKREIVLYSIHQDGRTVVNMFLRCFPRKPLRGVEDHHTRAYLDYLDYLSEPEP